MVAPPWTHSDLIIGSPSSLSDSRIKTQVTPIDSDTLLDACNSLSTSMYIRTDQDDGGPRMGLLAQEVEQMCQQFSLPLSPLISGKLGRVTDDGPLEALKALDYSRLSVLLLGGLKRLTQRVAQLENLPQ